LARYRKAQSAHKMPTVDSAALPPIQPYFRAKPAEESSSAKHENLEIPPNPVAEDSAAYSAATMGPGEMDQVADPPCPADSEQQRIAAE